MKVTPANTARQHGGAVDETPTATPVSSCGEGWCGGRREEGDGESGERRMLGVAFRAGFRTAISLFPLSPLPNLLRLREERAGAWNRRSGLDLDLDLDLDLELELELELEPRARRLEAPLL